MPVARRTWIKQAGLAVAGMSLFNRTTAAPTDFLNDRPNNKIVKLNANENPYGPSPMARQAMLDAIVTSNRYPWQYTTELREKIAASLSLTKEHILIGAGSSEILGLVAQYAALQKGNAVTADITFSIWCTAAEQVGLRIIKTPITSEKGFDLQAMSNSINNDTRLVYLCNPNNPTGTVLPPSLLKDFVEQTSKRSLVLMDEAYTEYANIPGLSYLTAQNKNLVIAKTFSKIHGLAGARIGYAVAHPDTIRQLNKLQPWENAGASAVSLAAAIGSIGDTAFVNDSRQKNTAVAEQVYKAFTEMNVPFIRSHANFIYFSAASFKEDFAAQLQQKQVICGRTVEPIGKWTRITIGTSDEMNIFINELQKLRS